MPRVVSCITQQWSVGGLLRKNACDFAQRDSLQKILLQLSPVKEKTKRTGLCFTFIDFLLSLKIVFPALFVRSQTHDRHAITRLRYGRTGEPMERW